MDEVTCAEVNDEFIEFQQFLPAYVSKKIQSDDAWIDLMPKEAFPDGAGKTYTYPVFGRGHVVGDTFATFDKIGANACDRPKQTVKFGSTTKDVTVREYSQQTELLCISNLQFYWRVNEQLKNTIDQLASITRLTWSQEYQNAYVGELGHIVLADADRTEGGVATDMDPMGNFPATTPTSPLTWGVLEYIRRKLILRYGREGTAGFDNDNRPVFYLFTDTGTQQDLKLQDPNFRDDVRWAYTQKGDDAPTIKGTGLNQKIAYRGFKFTDVDFPPRYSFSGGDYTQIFPYVTVVGTNGDEWELATGYEGADYQLSVIYMTNAMRHLVVKPSAFPTSGYKYDAAQNYAGDMLWKLQATDRECNPNGDKGWWQLNYLWGAQDLRMDDLGYGVLHKVCAAPNDVYACAQNSPSGS